MGKPQTIIDWKKVEDLLITGCSGREIAGFLGIHPNTIYQKCLEEHGVQFSEYSLQFYSKGDSILRAHQFAKALGKTTEGDNTLLIWLGKTRLKQKDESQVIQQGNITVNVGKELGSGLNVSTATIPDTADNSSE